MEKIYGYDSIYRDNLGQLLASHATDRPLGSEEDELKRLKTSLKSIKNVEEIQLRQFERINQSCGEHAVISLATAFETYYKELIQELLSLVPDFFHSTQTVFSNHIRQLIEDTEERNYEDISEALKLRKRWDYYKFFSVYSIPFLSPEEQQFVESIYAMRNNFVHNAGKPESKNFTKAIHLNSPDADLYVSTEAKKMRTRFKRMIAKVDEKLRETVFTTEPQS